MKKFLVAVAVAFFYVNIVQAEQSVIAFKATVNCRSPKPGVYTLGWGTSRLTITQNGRSFYTFRTQSKPVEDKLCQAGDNNGVVAFRSDGTVWAYVNSTE
jgi:hypothetical protein